MLKQNRISNFNELMDNMNYSNSGGSRKLFDEMIEKAKSEDYSSGAVQWGVRGRLYSPQGKSVQALPSGWYKFGYNGYTTVPELMPVRNDELIRLPFPEYGAVLEDMKKFWDSKDIYKKYNFPYKRGLLIYGHQGTGKSGLIRLIAEDVISKGGVVFNIGGSDDIYAFESNFAIFRELEPDRIALCVMEDVDNLMGYGSTTQKLLNILDGNLFMDNVIFLATTNFPDRLLQSIINRPSRFDRRYEIGLPDENVRRVYITKKFPSIDKEKIDELVNSTEGFTIDALKEAVLSNIVLGYDLKDVIAELKKLFSYQGRMSDSFEKNLADGIKNLHDSFDDELNRD